MLRAGLVNSYRSVGAASFCVKLECFGMSEKEIGVLQLTCDHVVFPACQDGEVLIPADHGLLQLVRHCFKQPAKLLLRPTFVKSQLAKLASSTVLF